MDFQTTRWLVLEYIKEKYPEGNIQFAAVINQITSFAKDKGIKKSFTEEDAENILDIVNSLMHEGVLRWGLNSGNPEPPFIGITAYGKKVLKSDDPIPYDPDGYLQRLREKIPNLDENTQMYLVESLQTFLRNNFMASGVMLGVASEAIFNILYDELINSVQSIKIKQKLERIRDSAKTKQRIDLFKDIVLITYKTKIPYELTDDFESKTDPLFNLMRQIRNDVGHPTGIKIERMTMFVNLQLFVPYCETAYKWIQFLKENKI